MDDTNNNSSQDPQAELPQVVEGELIAPEGAEELLNITGLIKTYITKTDTMVGSIQKAQEMLNDILDNDETYRNHSDAVKEASKIRNQTKTQIMRTPQAQDLAAQVKEARVALKEMKQTLSEYLADYQRMTGSNEFEDEAGTIRKIIFLAKLVK